MIKIQGGNELSGNVFISGAKNSAVALLPIALMTEEDATICNVPDITDIDDLIHIIEYLGGKVEKASGSLVINSKDIVLKPITEEFSSKLRASYYFMGALLGRFGKIKIDYPGGCSIGKRPIDLHLKGFESMGCTIQESGSILEIEALSGLKGADIYLDIASVGATINLMMAATLAEGKTVIRNAAREPEIVNIATFLNNLGGNIVGAGTSEITIQGVKKLTSGFIEVIPDRIEAGTYIVLGALLGNNYKVKNIIPKHIEPLLLKLQEMGSDIVIFEDEVLISHKKLKGAKISTEVYPGFPTDLQQIITVLLALSDGKSSVRENLFENRYMHIPYLNDMGTNIEVNGNILNITGVDSLIGKEVVATDLRAGAALVLAGLVAKGETVIKNSEHVLRGYENLAQKLQDVGANIEVLEHSNN